MAAQLDPMFPNLSRVLLLYKNSVLWPGAEKGNTPFFVVCYLPT